MDSNLRTELPHIIGHMRRPEIEVFTDIPAMQLTRARSR
jgi:hypothetical protein